MKLNDIVFDDFNLQELESSAALVPRREARALEADLSVDERLTRLATAGDTALEVAFQHYALERDRLGLVAMLQRGARTHVARLELRQACEGTLPWYYVQYVSWATAFSDGVARQRLFALPSAAAIAGRDNVAMYGHLLTAFLRGEVIDEPLAALKEVCSARKAAKFLANTLLPCTLALRATLDGNGAHLDDALEQLLAQHKRDAKHEYRLDALRGFMAAPCLFYVRIALERGIPLTIDSPYLPVWLVDLCRTTPPSAS